MSITAEVLAKTLVDVFEVAVAELFRSGAARIEHYYEVVGRKEYSLRGPVTNRRDRVLKAQADRSKMYVVQFSTELAGAPIPRISVVISQSPLGLGTLDINCGGFDSGIPSVFLPETFLRLAVEFSAISGVLSLPADVVLGPKAVEGQLIHFAHGMIVDQQLLNRIGGLDALTGLGATIREYSGDNLEYRAFVIPESVFTSELKTIYSPAWD